MLVLFYNNKVILSHAKRGSRMLTRHTMFNDVYQIDITHPKEVVFDKIQKSNKKIYCLNRNPISHISSGIWNTLEPAYSKGEESILHKTFQRYGSVDSEFDYKLIDKLLYVSSNSNRPDINEVSNIEEKISQSDMLRLLNFFIFFYNQNHTQLESAFKSDGHVYPNQSLVKECVEEFGCELVDIEEVDNLLSYLGFNFNDSENQKIKNLYSQQAPKKFFRMYLDYILHGDIQEVINHFKDIYGRCSVIKNSTLHKIIRYEPIIDFINNEVNIYNELKVNSNNTTTI